MGISATTISNSQDYFCLNKHHVEITKHDESVKFLQLNLDIIFEGINRTILEGYEYVFFSDKLTVYPGKIIEVFFPDIDINHILNDSENFQKPFLDNVCIVSFEIIEFDAGGNIVKRSFIEDVYFLPGKKPKAYPILSNGVVRSIYSNSFISLSKINNYCNVANFAFVNNKKSLKLVENNMVQLKGNEEE